MPWVEFLQAFDFAPAAKRGRVVLAYSAGVRALVSQACAEAAIKAGKARPIGRPDGDERKPRAIPRADE